MKSFDWTDLLRRHPIFSSLDDKHVAWLLGDDVSIEKSFPPGTAILLEHEAGDSVFLLGAGVVEVMLSGEAGQTISLATLRRGEVFGEMAFFERRSRSATVVAREPVTVLEIRGPQFDALVTDYPDIEFKVLLKMSDRLRQANEVLLTTHIKGVDEKLRLFAERLDVLQRTIDASLKAAHTVFDQTKLRTDEVIQAAERGQTRLHGSAAAVGAILTAILSLLGFFGYKEFSSIQGEVRAASKQIDEARAQVQTVVAAIRSDADDARTRLREATTYARELQKATVDLKGLEESFTQVKTQVREGAERRYLEAIASRSAGVQAEAEVAYRQLRSLDPADAGIIGYRLTELEHEFLDPDKSRLDWEPLLRVIREDARSLGARGDELRACYLLVANAVLAAASRTAQIASDCRRALGEARGLETKESVGVLTRLRELFERLQAPARRRDFERALGLPAATR